MRDIYFVNLEPEDAEMVAASPTFTQETKEYPKHFQLMTGDTFRAFCDILGSPMPSVKWYKDGHQIREPVKTFADGRSTVEFEVLGTADSGTYSCRATNQAGENVLHFRLDVLMPEGGVPPAVVTDVGPDNATVVMGESISLHCTVRSFEKPRIKWLKRLARQDVHPADTLVLDVENERYSVLGSGHFEANINDNEYINHLIVANADEDDGGLYICLVTNSGFGALTYKPIKLQIVQDDEPQSDHSSFNVIMVSSLSVAVFVLVVIMVVCVVRHASTTVSSDTQSSNGSTGFSFCSVEKPNHPPFLQPHNHSIHPEAVSKHYCVSQLPFQQQRYMFAADEDQYALPFHHQQQPFLVNNAFYTDDRLLK